VGLARLAVLSLDPRIAEHHRFDAVLAHLHERAGDWALALQHYDRAAARTPSTAERDYLHLHAARLRSQVLEPSTTRK
jgi:predicted RNA polymerase sigma factor